MRQRTRKLIGSAALFAFVIFWALFAITIAELHASTLSDWAQEALIIFLGLIWVIPAGLLIRWMARRDIETM